MDEENQFMENSVEISNLNNVVTENFNDSNNNSLNNSVEGIKTIEEKTPKKKSKIRKFIFIILGILGVLLLIRLAFVFLFIKGISNLAEQMGSTNISVNQEDGLYKFNGRGLHNGIANYMLTPVNANKIVIGDEIFKASYDDSLQNMITLSVEDYDWLDGIYNFKSYINLDLEFSGGKIINWNIIDERTKKKLGHLSTEELNQLYNFEAKYPIEEIKTKQMINLSDLDENVIYKYVVKATSDVIPGINNDLDYDVIIYEKTSSGYEPKILFSKESESGWFKLDSSDETHYFIYQKASKEDILYVLKPLSLGQYNHGEEINIRSEDYLYNDTNDVLKLVFIDESFGEKEEKEKKALKPGEVYKKGSFIDYVIIK